MSTDPPPVRSPRELPEFREWWLALHTGESWGTATDVTAEHAAIHSGLREGVLWYLAADALDFIDAAAETLPTEITLGPGLAPARSGLIYGNGSLLPQVRGPVVAMAWTQRDEGLLLASIYLHKSGRLAMGFTTWPWGDSWHQDDDLGATIIRGQLTTMWLVAQTPRAVTQSDIAPSRPQVRRAARAELSDPTVRVFDLRGTQRDEAETVPGSTPGQRYRHRWGVRPHWPTAPGGPTAKRSWCPST